MAELWLNMALSLDGHLSPGPEAQTAFTSKEDKRRMAQLRVEADAVIVGAATVRADDPPFQIRGLEREFAPPPLLVLGQSIPAQARLLCVGERRIWRVGAQGEDLPMVTALLAEDLAGAFAACQDLAAREGWRTLLLEGGGKLFGFALTHGLADRIYQTHTGVAFGAASPTSILGPGEATLSRYRLESCEAVGDEIFVCWRRKDS